MKLIKFVCVGTAFALVLTLGVIAMLNRLTGYCKGDCDFVDQLVRTL